MGARLTGWLELRFWQLAVLVLGVLRPLGQAGSKVVRSAPGLHTRSIAGATLLLSFGAGVLLGWFW